MTIKSWFHGPWFHSLGKQWTFSASLKTNQIYFAHAHLHLLQCIIFNRLNVNWYTFSSILSNYIPFHIIVYSHTSGICTDCYGGWVWLNSLYDIFLTYSIEGYFFYGSPRSHTSHFACISMPRQAVLFPPPQFIPFLPLPIHSPLLLPTYKHLAVSWSYCYVYCSYRYLQLWPDST